MDLHRTFITGPILGVETGGVEILEDGVLALLPLVDSLRPF